MSGGTYRYDLSDLTGVAGGLSALAGDYESASAHREDADAALGYGDLRAAVRDFVGNWEHERGQQLEAIDGSATALRGIIEDYVEHDRTSAGGVRGGGGPR